MYFKSWVRGSSMVLASLLFAATVSACSSGATASSGNQPIVSTVVAAAVSGQEEPSAAQATAPAAPTAITMEPTAALTNTPDTAQATQSSQPAATAGATSTAAKINLNTATAEQILSVPNTGNRMVREFQEYRPYLSILTFRQEIGKYVDAATVAGYERYVYVPVDPNQSDAATLQQIPGVTADLAQSLIAARPYASSDAFLARLAENLSADQVAAAKAYLQ